MPSARPYGQTGSGKIQDGGRTKVEIFITRVADVIAMKFRRIYWSSKVLGIHGLVYLMYDRMAKPEVEKFKMAAAPKWKYS